MLSLLLLLVLTLHLESNFMSTSALRSRPLPLPPLPPWRARKILAAGTAWAKATLITRALSTISNDKGGADEPYQIQAVLEKYVGALAKSTAPFDPSLHTTPGPKGAQPPTRSYFAAAATGSKRPAATNK